MKLIVYKDYQTLSQQTAERIASVVRKNPKALLCFASGETPLLTYQCLVKKHSKGEVDFSQCAFAGMDEWLGIPADNSGSCRYFHEQHFLNPLKIPKERIYLFDALTADPEGECAAMDKFIADHDGVEVMVVGIGMNGHVGFNEPGISHDLYSHVIDLDTTTQTVGQKYFSEPTLLKKGITLGLRHVQEARQVILMASGLKKSDIVKKSFQETPTSYVPASILQYHSNAFVLLDEDAGASLDPSGISQS